MFVRYNRISRDLGGALPSPERGRVGVEVSHPTRPIGGAHFRRQSPAGRYVLDFYCPALALAIELDGGQHAEAGTRDRERDKWLTQKGVTILRFWNSDVVENLDGVLEVIAAKIGKLGPASALSRPRWRSRLTPTPTLPLSGGESAPPGSRHTREAP